MTVPTFDQFLSPLLLQLVAHPDGMTAADAIEAVAVAVDLSEDDRKVRLPSGVQATYENRIHWAQHRLKRAGLTSMLRRGVWKVTEAGIALAAKHPDGLPASEFNRITAFAGESDDGDEPTDDPSTIAEKQVDGLYRDVDQRRACLAFMAEAIERAHTYSPAVWEVTFNRRRVRLNVGMLATIDLEAGRIGFGLIPERLPLELKAILDDVGEWLSPFKTVPITRFCKMPVATFVAELGRLKSAFEEFLAIAGVSARQTPYASAHSPAFVEFLERAVGRTLPRPEYVRRERGTTTEEPDDVPVERAVAFDAPRALFKKVDYDLTTLLSYIEMGDIGLPDIQRPFVWSAAKVRDLFDSMYRGFPIGYLLLWENAEIQTGRAIGAGEKSRKTPSRLIVDGQQRLTSLYAVIKGKRVVDEDYQETTIEVGFRPRDGRFEVTDAAIRKDPEWISNISDVWASGKPIYRLNGDFLKTLKEKRPLDTSDEDAMSHNISRLFDLQKYPFTALEILPNVEEEAVADIFVRINSDGVKLNQADFILTMLSVHADDVRADLEQFARAARIVPAPGGPPSPFNHLIQPSPDQMLRVSIALGFHRGRLKSVYQVLRGKDLATGRFTAEKREAQFQRLREAQTWVLDLKHWHLFLGSLAGAGFRSAEMISSETSVLYAYAFYLIGRFQCGVEEHVLRRLISRWFFMAALTGRYTNSTETVMDADLGRLMDIPDAAAFVGTLDRIIADTLTGDYWSITVPNELETSSSRSPALLAYYAAQNRIGSPVLFSDRRVSELTDPALRLPRKSLERHHLFPRSWLERNGVTDLKLINQAANYAFVEWPDNAKVSDQPPARYIAMMRERFSPAVWERMTALNALPGGWETMPYLEFLKARRKLMAGIIRRGFESLSGGDDGEETPFDGSAEEQKAWAFIKDVERMLRRLVRTKYAERWANDADGRMRKVLGDEAWGVIERNREKHQRQYPLSPTEGQHDVLEYCYLGQLMQLMVAGPAWDMFKAGFRDKRQLEDMLGDIMPVRNDQAHFRRVPDRELTRCQMACEDLRLVIG